MMTKLTRRQQAIYDYLRTHTAAFEHPPTLDELCQALGMRSRGSLHKHIQALVTAGLVEPLNGKQRGIRLSESTQSVPAVELPFLGRIAAGRPIEAVNDETTVTIPANLTGSGPCYVLEVRGDSMIEDGILDGDRVVVESRNHARNGEVVVALIDHEEVTLKRIEQRPGKVILHPANSQLSAMEFPPERVTVQGVLVGLMRSYR